MTLQEVKSNLNREVRHKDYDNLFKLNSVILRKSKKGYFYQAEILDLKHKNSVLIVSLEDIYTYTP